MHTIKIWLLTGIITWSCFHLAFPFMFYEMNDVLETFMTSINNDGSGYSYPILPEARLNAIEIIEMYGYVAEAHEVVTPDGYLLEIHRLRSPKYRANYSSHGLYPVVVQHGILTSSASWLLNGKRDSLAFVLADEGYDVWLSNLRGNRYAQRHLRLTPDDDEFWNFTLDEFALMDLPSTIDHVLKVTDRSKLSLIAHSMGTTVTMLMLSQQLQFNDKLDIAILMAPVMYGRYLRNPLRVVINHIDEFTKLKSKLGINQILPPNPIAKGLTLTACTEYPLTIACAGAIQMIGGYDSELLDRPRMHLFLQHYDTTAWKVARHYAQILFSETLPKRFDQGPRLNLAKYGQPDPPYYNLSKITPPLALFYGYMDLYVDRKDLQRLTDQLTNVVLLEKVPYDLWAHQDFVIARDAYKHFYSRLLQVLRKHINYYMT